MGPHSQKIQGESLRRGWIQVPWQYCLDGYLHLLDLLFSKSSSFSVTPYSIPMTQELLLSSFTLSCIMRETRAQKGKSFTQVTQRMPRRPRLEPTSTRAPNHFDGNRALMVRALQIQGTKMDSNYSAEWEFPVTLSITGHLLLLSLRDPSGPLFASRVRSSPMCPLHSAP